MFKGKKYYGDFVKSEEKIATNILADRLLILEHEGIISKSMGKSDKQKIIYKLTQKGIDLITSLVEIIMWPAKYDKKSVVDMKFVKSVRKDREGLLKDLSGTLLSA